MRLEHHLVGGYVRYISPHIIIIIIIYIYIYIKIDIYIPSGGNIYIIYIYIYILPPDGTLGRQSHWFVYKQNSFFFTFSVLSFNTKIRKTCLNYGQQKTLYIA